MAEANIVVLLGACVQKLAHRMRLPVGQVVVVSTRNGRSGASVGRSQGWARVAASGSLGIVRHVDRSSGQVTVGIMRSVDCVEELVCVPSGQVYIIKQWYGCEVPHPDTKGVCITLARTMAAATSTAIAVHRART